MDRSSKKDDASPLSTSSESETFDTWTLISDKPKDLASDETAFTQLTPEKSDDDGDNADGTVRLDAVKEPELLHDNRYTDMDDLSDGISIISECESVGRLSPHPELRKRLSDINLLYTSISEPPAAREESCQTLNFDASSERAPDVFHRVEPLLETNRRSRGSSTQQLVESKAVNRTPYGLRGLFYFGAFLAIIAFISKLKSDAWESALGSKTELLTQKINELELNNNLMRAEIDILSKQVKYLTSLSENPKSAHRPKNNQPRENAFKAWPGNGNKIEEVMITPEDLKKPYQCDGHNNVDLAGMCIDLDNSKDPETMKTDEANDNDSITIEDLMDSIPEPSEEPIPEIYQGQPEAGWRISPSPYKSSENEYTPHEHKGGNRKENKKYEKRDNHKKHSKNHSGESKENDKPRRRDSSSEEREKLAEQHKKRSKEYKKKEQRGSAEYEKAKREADGYWLEKMMEHRARSREDNDRYRQELNWYIERGDSREQARFDHEHHHGHGRR